MALLTAPFPQYPDIFGMVRQSANDAARMQVERQQLAMKARDQYLAEQKQMSNTILETASLSQKMKALQEEKNMNLLQLAERRKQQDFANKVSLQRATEAERHNKAMENRSSQRAPSMTDRYLALTPDPIGPVGAATAELPVETQVTTEEFTNPNAAVTETDVTTGQFPAQGDFNAAIGAPATAFPPASTLLPGPQGQAPGQTLLPQKQRTPEQAAADIGLSTPDLNSLLATPWAQKTIEGRALTEADEVAKAEARRKFSSVYPKWGQIEGNLNAYLREGSVFAKQEADRSKQQAEIEIQRNALRVAREQLLAVTKDEALVNNTIPIASAEKGFSMGIPLPTPQLTAYIDAANKEVEARVSPKTRSPYISDETAFSGSMRNQANFVDRLEAAESEYKMLNTPGRVLDPDQIKRKAELPAEIAGFKAELANIRATIAAGQRRFTETITGMAPNMPTPMRPPLMAPAPPTTEDRMKRLFTK